MIEANSYTKQQIVAYFSRPDRSINQARISEIEEDHERHKGIEAATPDALDIFLREWGQLRFPGEPIAPPSPTHPHVLARQFPRKQAETLKLSVAETSFVEGKETFNWGSRSDYCRTLAGMANNNGGYLLFGVVDGTFEVSGIKSDRMEKFDLRKANDFITRTFNQALEIEKGQFVIDGKTIGALYVYPSKNKPVVCKLESGGLASGDIYFRYPGETRRVQAPELERILKARDAASENQVLQLVAKLAETGANNAAIINLGTGDVQGEGGRFVIEDSLLDKVKFIAQGRFVEKEGAPALRLVGEVQPVSSGKVTIQQSVVGSITERHIHEAFLYQRCRYEPTAYIQAQTHLQPLWLPIYYFATVAELDVDRLEKSLSESDTPYESRKEKQIERVRSGRIPAGMPAPSSVQTELDALRDGELFGVENAEGAKRLLQAIRLLEPDDLELERVLSTLTDLRARFGNTHSLLADFRYSIATVDLKWFRPIVTT